MNGFFALRGRFRNESNGNALSKGNNEDKLLLDEAIKIIEDAIDKKVIDLSKATEFMDKIRNEKVKNVQLEEENERHKAIKQAVYKIINQISLERDINYEFECPFCQGTAHFRSCSIGFNKAKYDICGYNEPL